MQCNDCTAVTLNEWLCDECEQWLVDIANGDVYTTVDGEEVRV